MSIYLRGGKHCVTIYDPGKKRKMWVGTFDGKREALKAERHALNELEQQRADSELIEVFHARWTVDHAAPKETTNLHNLERTKKFAEDFKGRTLDSIGRKEARRWALENRSRAAATRTMFSAAVREDLCQVNPFSNLRLPGSRGRQDLVVLTDEQLQTLLQAARDTWKDWGCRVYAPLIQFAAYSGLRAGECSGLRWDDIDFDARTIRVERQYSHKVAKCTLPKNGLKRTALLTDEAEQALAVVPRVRAEVFSTPQGKMFTGRVSAYYWHPTRAAFGDPDLRFHDLRHFFGTRCALRGLSAPDIALLMGHTDGGIEAMKTYVHMTEKGALVRGAAALGSGLRAVSDTRASSSAVDLREEKWPSAL